MQLDMHFYGTYALARLAGFPAETARTVATAAQFVDDAVEAFPVSLRDGACLLPVASSHTLLERENPKRTDQWRVWVPFHFLPGGRGDLAAEQLICLWGEPGNRAADAVLRLALEAGAAGEPYAPHLLGIVAHVIQDTYAHYGFSGIAHEGNRVVRQSLRPLNARRLGSYLADKLDAFFQRLSASACEASLLGHAGAATLPDRPYLKWTLCYERPPRLDVDYLDGPRDNPASYLLACTRLHALFHAYLAGETELNGNGHRPFSDAPASEIIAILSTEGKKEERCERWRDGIEAGLLFDPVPEDHHLRYTDAGWSLRTLSEAAEAEASDAYRFNRAAGRYLEAVYDDILPGMGILDR